MRVYFAVLKNGEDKCQNRGDMSQQDKDKRDPVKLECDETPLAWPQSVALSDLTPCSTCGIKLFAPQPGTLQVLTRRGGGGVGVGDGVTIQESISVGADYRGQRYSLEEVVFHTPGLHVFPGETETYPAELHIHLRTMASPVRFITVVIPASHRVSESATPTSSAYFSAIAAKPDATIPHPTLESLLGPAQVLQYQGPDVRGRTADTPTPDSSCSGTARETERQFLMILRPVYISARDLERIPREGSLSSDPRDLPALGVKPTKTVPRDRLVKSIVLASPGLLGFKGGIKGEGNEPTQTPGSSHMEHECKPLKVVNGRDVVDISGKSIDLLKLLTGEDNSLLSSSSSSSSDPSAQAQKQADAMTAILVGCTMFLGTFIGLYLAQTLCTEYVWKLAFANSPRIKMESLTLLYFVLIAAGSASGSDSIRGLMF